MQNKTARPFGLWSSPLSPRALAGALRLGDVMWAGDGDVLVWSEGRGAQTMLVAKRGQDAPVDLFTEHSARGGVGYGGGELGVYKDQVYFANKDGRLYQVALDYGTPRALTPPFGSMAAPAPSPCGSVIAYVHTDGHDDAVGVIDAHGKRWPAKVASGADFYMQPTWSPSGERLAWVSWDHPQMPWDGALLQLAGARIADGELELEAPQVIAGDTKTSVQQPCFSPDGQTLAYLSDASGYTHIHLYGLSDGAQRQLSQGSFDLAGPAWVQGLRSIAWAPDSQSIWAIRNSQGFCTLVRYTLDGSVTEVSALSDYEHLAQLCVSPTTGQLALIASASTIPARLITFDPETGDVQIIKRSSAERLAPEALAPMKAISWSSPQGHTVHGNYYPPTSPRFEAQGAPPLVVLIHGGPTTQALASYNSRAQLFATRGYAVLEVNYRGSTGYGREYMELLRGQWGVYDVEDAIGGAQRLVDDGLADPKKLVIMGGSAGGYTVLQALTDHPGFFAAGISMYGISDLFALTATTHKFESHYNDSLLGVLPQDAELFKARSPVFKAERLSDALAIFQGDQDKVVPPEQAELIAKSLRARGVTHLYHVYEGEGHGWRKPETIEHFYKAVLEFLERHILYK